MPPGLLEALPPVGLRRRGFLPVSRRRAEPALARIQATGWASPAQPAATLGARAEALGRSVALTRARVVPAIWLDWLGRQALSPATAPLASRAAPAERWRPGCPAKKQRTPVFSRL